MSNTEIIAVTAAINGAIVAMWQVTHPHRQKFFRWLGLLYSERRGPTGRNRRG